MIAVAMALTSMAILYGRPFWSRGYLAVSALTWLGLALAHRWVRRRRPWADRMVLVTNEKALIEAVLAGALPRSLLTIDKKKLSEYVKSIDGAELPGVESHREKNIAVRTA